MDVIAAYRDVGSYLGAAPGTTWGEFADMDLLVWTRIVVIEFEVLGYEHESLRVIRHGLEERVGMEGRNLCADMECLTT